ANRSGERAAADAGEVLARLGTSPDLQLILDGGRVAGGVASTVVDCATGPARILRTGAIADDLLAAVLDEAELEHHLRG
ncbi:MAG: Sua5/YciO/YrdC/YwlC family protein, partial [Chloroflexota bacterium]|nr:Sua5/YciO/YrdC/YwlC family protein [Chloroflexota bacterium]